MFNPEEYFKLVKKALHTCAGEITHVRELAVESPSGDWELWSTITWGLTLKWESGETLEVQEFYRRNKAKILRVFRYHFMDDDKKCIFRFDTHGDEIGIDDPCHLHAGEERLDDDDAKLHGFRTADINFLTAHSLAYRHFKGKPMPWE